MNISKLVEKFVIFLSSGGKHSASTISSYKNDISKFVNYLIDDKNNDMRNVTKDNVVDYLDKLAKGYSENTVSRNLTSIKKFFAFLKAENIIEENNIRSIPSKVILFRAPQTLTEEKIRKVIDEIDLKTADGVRDRAIIDVIYSTGVKASELIDLQIGQYDSVNMNLCVKGEDKTTRYLRLSEKAIINLNRYLSLVRREVVEKTGSKEEFIFLGRYGRKLTRNWIWRIVAERFDEAGFTSKITPQIIRHSFAENALKKGVDIKIIQGALGHARKNITSKTYIIPRR